MSTKSILIETYCRPFVGPPTREMHDLIEGLAKSGIDPSELFAVAMDGAEVDRLFTSTMVPNSGLYDTAPRGLSSADMEDVRRMLVST